MRINHNKLMIVSMQVVDKGDVGDVWIWKICLV